MNTSLSLHYPGTEDEVRKQRSESNTADIRKEIEPVATTVCRTIFLQKFDCSAHQDRAQDGSDPSMPQHIVVFAMVAQELDPQHTGQAAYIQRWATLSIPTIFPTSREGGLKKER